MVLSKQSSEVSSGRLWASPLLNRKAADSRNYSNWDLDLRTEVSPSRWETSMRSLKVSLCFSVVLWSGDRHFLPVLCHREQNDMGTQDNMLSPI